MITADDNLLAGLDDEARQQAVSSLFDHLAHQGTRRRASPYAVPFLARIALAGPDRRGSGRWSCCPASPSTGTRSARSSTGPTAVWRAEAAENSSDKLLQLYEEALATEQDEQRRRTLQDMRDRVADGDPVDARDAAMRSYDAVLAELPVLLGPLDDENPRVRIRTAYLLAWLPELAGSSLDAEDDLVRWAAAVAIAQSARNSAADLDGPLLDRAVAELAAVAAASAPVPATDYSLGDFHGHTADVLLALPPSPTSRAPVAACLPSVSVSRKGFTAKAVLPDVFPSPLPDPSPDPSSIFCTPSPLTGTSGGLRQLMNLAQAPCVTHLCELMESFIVNPVVLVLRLRLST